MGQRGTALLTTLGLMLLLLPLGAYVLLQCRTDLMIERNFRYEIEAFYVAEAGLHHAVADIRPAWSFDGVLAGPDGIAGTADDGLFPFTEGAPLDFPFPPFRYEVHVTPLAEAGVSVISRGSGRNGATKVVGAMVARSPLVWTPAALYGQRAVGRIDLGDGRFLVSGFDHRMGDSPPEPTGTADPVPALGSSHADAEETVRRGLSNELAARFVGPGGPPSIATTAAVEVTAVVAEIARRADCLRLTEISAGEPPPLGTADAPRLAVVSGDVDVVGRVSGNGVLVVEGRLRVTGQFEYAGLVVALGGILFDSSSDVVVAGALWHAASGDEALQLHGAGAVVYSSQALARVDTAFPALLPHAAIVTGWLEQL
jgi:hypothetical protein